MDRDEITRREAAALAGVHTNTIRLWEQAGRVTPRKADNGVVWLPRAEVEAIMEQRRDIARDDGSRIAALEAENRMLNDELTRVREQYDRLLDRIILLAGDGTNP